MQRKLISLAGLLVLVFSLVSAGETAAQDFGNSVQSGGDCNCDCAPGHCCSKIWRCLYGQMVSNGTGGAFRIYGFPRPRCCGNQPCGYPVWGMGYSCLNGCPQGVHPMPRQQIYPGFSSANRKTSPTAIPVARVD